MTRRTSLTVQVPSPIGLYTAGPVLEELRRRGVEVHLSARSQVLDLAGRQGLAFTPAPLEPLEHESRQLRRLHSALTVSLTDWDFSTSYRMRMEEQITQARRSRRALLRTLDRVPGMRGPALNRLLDVAQRVRRSNPYPSDHLLVVSPAVVPYLLPSSGLRIDTLMESWDHPSKKPAGYRTHRIIGWNQDLNEDWTAFQGPAEHLVGYPFKLRYFLEPTRGPLAGSNHRRGTVMYAATSSSMYRYGRVWEEESRLIDGIAEACRQAGLRLLVKPKPTGVPGEFDVLATRHDHLHVAPYGQASTPVDYFLDDAYNEQRLHDLRRVDLVITFGTTFAIDAAAAGVPVLQLDLRPAADLFPDSAFVSHNHHLARHLLSRAPHTFRIEGNSWRPALSEFLATDSAMPHEYSASLRAWIKPDAPCESATNRLVEAILT